MLPLGPLAVGEGREKRNIVWVVGETELLESGHSLRAATGGGGSRLLLLFLLEDEGW